MVAITVVLASVLLVLVLNIGEGSVIVTGSTTFDYGDGLLQERAPNNEWRYFSPGFLTVSFLSQSLEKSDIGIHVDNVQLVDGQDYNWTGSGDKVRTGSVASTTSYIQPGSSVQLIQLSTGNVIAYTNAPPIQATISYDINTLELHVTSSNFPIFKDDVSILVTNAIPYPPFGVQYTVDDHGQWRIGSGNSENVMSGTIIEFDFILFNPFLPGDIIQLVQISTGNVFAQTTV